MLLLEDKLAKYTNIKLPEQFGIFTEEEDCSYSFDNFCDEVVAVNNKANIRHGVSKAVVIDPECTYVLKAGFNGSFYYHYSDNIDDENYEEEFEPFFSHENYCEYEHYIYEEMKKRGFAEFFARVVPVPNTPYYTQERCNPYSNSEQCRYDHFCDKNYDSRYNKERTQYEKYKKSSGKIYTCFYDSLNFVYDLFKTYGEEKTTDFLNFLQKEKFGISQDMHTGNFGYRLSDGTPCLIDYSGWCEDC